MSTDQETHVAEEHARAEHDHRMPPAFKWVAAGTAVAALLIVGSLAAMALSRGGGPPMEVHPAFEGVTFPDFVGVGEGGQEVTGAILDGEVTVLDFFFTHCPAICPEMTARMKEQANALEGTDVRFLSVSVDPENDTPERLAEWATQYGADTSRWTFTRTTPNMLEHIATELGFALQQSEASQIRLPDGSTMANIIHPTHMMLVGPDRRIYGRYYYRSEEDLAQLSEDAERLLRQR